MVHSIATHSFSQGCKHSKAVHATTIWLPVQKSLQSFNNTFGTVLTRKRSRGGNVDATSRQMPSWCFWFSMEKYTSPSGRKCGTIAVSFLSFTHTNWHIGQCIRFVKYFLSHFSPQVGSCCWWKFHFRWMVDWKLSTYFDSRICATIEQLVRME